MRSELEEQFSQYSVNIDNIEFSKQLTALLNKFLGNQIEWRTTFKCLSLSNKSPSDFLKKTASYLLLDKPMLSEEIMGIIRKEFPELLEDSTERKIVFH